MSICSELSAREVAEERGVVVHDAAPNSRTVRVEYTPILARYQHRDRLATQRTTCSAAHDLTQVAVVDSVGVRQQAQLRRARTQSGSDFLPHGHVVHDVHRAILE